MLTLHLHSLYFDHYIPALFFHYIHAFFELDQYARIATFPLWNTTTFPLFSFTTFPLPTAHRPALSPLHTALDLLRSQNQVCALI